MGDFRLGLECVFKSVITYAKYSYLSFGVYINSQQDSTGLGIEQQVDNYLGSEQVLEK